MARFYNIIYFFPINVFALYTDSAAEKECRSTQFPGINWPGLKWKNEYPGKFDTIMTDQDVYVIGGGDNGCGCSHSCETDFVWNIDQGTLCQHDAIYVGKTTNSAPYYVYQLTDYYPAYLLYTQINNGMSGTSYDFYLQHYDYYLDSSYNLKTQYTTIDGSPSINIYDLGSGYTYVRDSLFFSFWYDYFNLSDFAVSTKSAVKPVVGSRVPGSSSQCYFQRNVPAYFIVPSCYSESTWRLDLSYYSSGSALRLYDNGFLDSVTWKLYSRPTFPYADSVLLYTWACVSQMSCAYRTFDKSLLTQDQTVYTMDGVTYQGTSYWYVEAYYQGNYYVYTIYQTEPPCSGVVSNGEGYLTGGKGSGFSGVGRNFMSWGGYEEPKH